MLCSSDEDSVPILNILFILSNSLLLFALRQPFIGAQYEGLEFLDSHRPKSRPDG